MSALERLTLTYWKLSRGWNGRDSNTIKMEDALETTCRIAVTAGAGFNLIRATEKMELEMIIDGRKRLQPIPQVERSPTIGRIHDTA